ncbi:hypothetical protein CQA25_20045, partial [Morganella morganii]
RTACPRLLSTVTDGVFLCKVLFVLFINSVLIKGIDIRTSLILLRRIAVYFRKNNQNRQSESWEMLRTIMIN